MKRILAVFLGLLILAFVIGTNRKHEIAVIFVPHHNIVASERLQFIEEVKNVSKNDIKQIVLLAPNHYGYGLHDIQLYEEDFSTQNGIVQVSDELIEVAKQAGALTDNGGFVNEHGIKNILPDIAKIFPDAEVLPVLIKLDTPQEAVTEFVNSVASDCHDCLMVASVDFSHYQPYLISEFHDDITLDALKSLDKDFVASRAEIGEPPAALAAMVWAEYFDSEKFVLYKHTNSNEIGGNLFSEGTSHIFGWYEAGKPAKKYRQPSVSIVGDMMFDHDADTLGSHTVATSLLGPRVLMGTDILLGNLESSFVGVKTDDPFKFVAGEGADDTLEFLKFNALNLDNNHSHDFGGLGFAANVNAVAEIGAERLDFESSIVVDTTKPKLAILSYYYRTSAGIEQKIEDYSEAGYKVMIYAHWGDEFVQSSNQTQQDLARAWINVGADLVVGTGSHVVQEAEVYDSVPIIYSLGNFYYSEEFNPSREGIILKVKFSTFGVTLLPSLISFDGVKPLLERNQTATDRIRLLWPALDGFIDEQAGGISYYIGD